MAVISHVESNYLSADIKATKSESKGKEVNQNKYSPKLIAELLAEKDRNGKAFFFFSGISDYITLYSNGQLNVRGGEEDLFRAWGKSEFRNIKSHTVFQELEEEIERINVPVSGRDYAFNSYGEFISWLTYQGDKN